MRYLKNLVTQQTYNDILPWHWTTKPPAAALESKEARTRWALSPRTNHHCYSPYEGLNEQLRVTRAKGEEGNPPFKQSGLVVDYDAPWTQEGLLAGIARIAHAPNYIEATLSNNARLVWTFEQPIRLPGYEFAAEWAVFLAERINVNLLLPGVDQGALAAPERYYTNSGDWYELNTKPLASDLVQGWFVEFASGFAFKGKEYGEEIPLDQVIEMLRAKCSRFSEWPGDFTIGSQGPSFWIEGSTSPKSAIVKPGGILSFAAHATKLFYSWADICGHQEVDTSKAKTLGKAVENIFFDGRHYFRRLPNGSWKPFEKTDLLGHLKTTCKLSPKPDKNGSSQLDQAIQHIQDHQYVGGAAPFTFRKTGLVLMNGMEYLNTSVRRALQPAADPVVWGPDGSFPWVSKWLDVFFDPVEQKEWFLAWLAYFYQNATALTPQSGQNIFIAGGVGIGKTLLNRRVIGPLLGGFAEASKYLLGEDNFGSELFENAHWVVDDEAAVSGAQAHKKFTAILKQLAANNTFRYHAKFRQPLLVEWCGRVVITCNADEESIRILPNLSASVLDKLMLFKARNNSDGAFRFPSGTVGRNAREVLEGTLDLELPYFARWLQDFEIPIHLISEDPRFGITPYHDPDLVATANHSSALAGFAEILHDWTQVEFSTGDRDCWEGTSFQLHKALHADATATAALRNTTLDGLGRALSSLKNRGDVSISCREHEGMRLWRINRPASLTKAEVTMPEVKTGGKSKFEK